MDSYSNILEKLNRFTRKYYTKMLIKGSLLFAAFGLLFFLAIMGIEYLLWLDSTGRLILFLAFVGIEVYLLFKYILTPLFYLFKIKKGISDKQASLLIGKHFPNVGDKLYNLLDLAEDTATSELLLASINQRSENLDAVQFTSAINFSESLKQARYLVIPLVIFGLIWFSGNLGTFFGSYDRVVHYGLAYEAPAPFSFELISTDLNVLESETFMVQVTTFGEVRPKNMSIVIDGDEFLLQQSDGIFQHRFSPPLENTDFYFLANGIRSKQYRLKALNAPVIQSFKVVLDFPDYTGKLGQTLKSTGNATLPEGTKVTWQIQGRHTTQINLLTRDTVRAFKKRDETFELCKRIYSNFSYQIATSNNNVRDYEKLDFQFNIVKDAYPSIQVEQLLDSLNPNVSYYVGEVLDDYKVMTIKLICYVTNNGSTNQTIVLNRPNINFQQFYYTFPSGLDLKVNTNYSFYFEATDNDKIHGGKTATSQVFTMNLFDDNQLINKELELQQSIIEEMDKSLKRAKQQKKTLEKILQGQKERSQLNFNNQSRLHDFISKQQQQENMMQKFSKRLRENLTKSNTDDALNKLLKERLERHEIEAKKNEQLLKELNRIAEKINKEDLAKRLEELGKKQRNNERNLEQLLELTKRYYVTEKAAQLAKDLDILAKSQEILSELPLEDDFSSEKQEDLNKEFSKIAEALTELKKDDDALKKPFKLDIQNSKSDNIKKDQQDALEEINKQKGNEESSESGDESTQENKASKKQKSAANKIKEMSEQLQKSSSAGGGGSTITEDAEMLRQILDNLITFSFRQESLFDGMGDEGLQGDYFSRTIRSQRELGDLFRHIDDSLFALSLRRAELSEFVNEQINEVYYNIDKALENIAERQSYQGVSYQKYVLKASNSLADFLANILDNIQSSMMSGSGAGEGEGFQLPDIIKGQGEVKEKMKGKGKKEQKGKRGEGQAGEPGKDGKGESKGKKGKDGTKRGEGEGKGKEGGSSEGQGGEQLGEEELQEIYEIYKSQQMLRDRLEKQLEDMIERDDRNLAKKLVGLMKGFEDDLLENGITHQTISKVNTIQYELLKLENAALKQGQKPERESNTNSNEFINPITSKSGVIEDYHNEVEILNRQALPLRQIFKNKVKAYFKNDN
ncbi:MAG: hypothetical protein QM485_06405 [Flavobacteriaceae bacterium]